MAFPNYGNYGYYNQYDPYSMMRQPQMPIQQMQQPIQNQQAGIVWVNGEKEAIGYPVMPNAAIAMWDSNSPAIYLKQADASGKPTFKAFDLVERTAPTQADKVPSEEFVTRKEFESLQAKIDGMAKMPPFVKEDM